MECLKFKIVPNKYFGHRPPEQGTKDQMILGFLITSHGTPKVLCTTKPWTTCAKQYIKRQLWKCHVKLFRNLESFGLLFLVQVAYVYNFYLW